MDIDNEYGNADQRNRKGSKEMGLWQRIHRNRAYEDDNRSVHWLYYFLAGFCLGILMINMKRDLFLDGSDLLEGGSMAKLAYLEVDSHRFLGYVLKERFILMAVMCFLGTTYAGGVVIVSFVLWLGMSAGIFLSAAAIRFGMRGVLFALAGVFPQYIFLVPACILLLGWCEQTYRGLYNKRVRFDFAFSRRKYLLCRSPKLFPILLLLVFACILEAYINPVLLTGLLRLFW